MALFKVNKPEEIVDDKYTRKTNIPQYAIKGEKPRLEELVNTERVGKLIANIKSSNVSEEEKAFLIKGAYRHLIFRYDKIAEYYAQASPEMQGLMEESALVIIDIDDAIMNGYLKVTRQIEQMTKDTKRRRKNET